MSNVQCKAVASKRCTAGAVVLQLVVRFRHLRCRCSWHRRLRCRLCSRPLHRLFRHGLPLRRLRIGLLPLLQLYQILVLWQLLHVFGS